MRRSSPSIALIVAAVALGAPAAAQGAAAVTNTNDSGGGSLRNALATAQPGETISIPAGTYRISSELVVADAGITLSGAAAANQVVIDAQGRSRALRVGRVSGTISLVNLTIVGGRTGGSGAGVLDEGDGTLALTNVAVRGNTSTGGSFGGAGLASTIGAVTFNRVTVSENVWSGGAGNGAGVRVAGSFGATNATISRNRFTTPTGAGGGLFLAGGSLTHSTVVANSAPTGGGGIHNSGATVTLRNTIVANNSPVNCAGPVTGSGNVVPGGTCGGGSSGGNPLVGALELNGGPTPTHELLPGSAALDAAGSDANCAGVATDQRGFSRTALGNCDSGSYEFDGTMTAGVPPCTRTGVIPLRIQSHPAEGNQAFNFRVDNGPLQSPGAGGQDDTMSITVSAEGRHAFEYFGTFDHGNEVDHHPSTIVVDRTNPAIAVNPPRFTQVVIKRRVQFDVNATDSISGLANPPNEAVDTSSRGTKTFTSTAVDLCQNARSASLGYQVLGPALGSRAVLEPLRGPARVASVGTNARASQRGRRFTALRVPREFRVGALVDTRRARVRLTTSRDRSTNVQDGEFRYGVFQVLQSRRRSQRGLTELRLSGGNFRVCAARRSSAITSASRRRIRRLRGKSSRARFRTRGRYSAATVRGTEWTVEDRCDGTLTIVHGRRGSVIVRDFRRRRNIRLRAGRRYLARAP